MGSFATELAASLGVEPTRILDAASGVQVDEFDGTRVPTTGAVMACVTSCGAVVACLACVPPRTPAS
jgi:hypothetical protein